jgi:hypothetical protein
LGRDEEEESDNEEDRQGEADFLRRVGPIMALGTPLMPPSHLTTTASPLISPHPSVTSPPGLPVPPLATERGPLVEASAQMHPDKFGQGEPSGGSQVSNSMTSQGGTEAMTTDKCQDVQDQPEIGNENAHVASLCEVTGTDRNQRIGDQTTETSVFGVPGIIGDKNQKSANGQDQDSNRKEDRPADAMGGAKASNNEGNRVSQHKDVNQSNSGDDGSDVEKGNDTSPRRSNRKRKTPPPPEHKGTTGSKPSRKKAKSKEQPLKAEHGMKHILQPDSGGIARSYFEEIEIGGTTKLVDMIDLTHDMVCHLSTQGYVVLNVLEGGTPTAKFVNHWKGISKCWSSSNI